MYWGGNISVCNIGDKDWSVAINDAANEYKTPGVIMEQWAYDGEDYQKWEIKSLDNGYYKIISVQSGSALSVPSGKTSTQDVELIQEIYTGDNRQQWKITQTQYGSYTIKPRSSEGLAMDLVMAVGDSITVGWDDTNVEQRRYVDNTKVPFCGIATTDIIFTSKLKQ